MTETLKCAYISYDKASLEIREKAALSFEELGKFLIFLKQHEFAREFFVLSTCNRTEIFYLCGKDRKELFLKLLSEFKGDPTLVKDKEFFISDLKAQSSARRLFEIANGIHSQILGDLQIIGQIKLAYEEAAKAGVMGAYLHRLLQTVFSCHKAVANATSIHSGNASVSSAAMEIVRDFLKKDKDREILIIGAGGFSREVIEQLKKRGIHNITISNRNPDKANLLSGKYNLNTIPFEEVGDLWCFDVVISCISSPEIIVKKEYFEINPVENKLLIDLSVPRSIDPGLTAMRSIRLINMNQISEKNRSALGERQKAIPKVLEIIEEYYQELKKWELRSTVRPVLHTLKNAIEHIRQQEIARAIKKNKNLIVEEAMVDDVTKNIVNKILKMPAIQLGNSGAEYHDLSKALVKLFDLENTVGFRERYNREVH